jgi:hypothetical protein
MSYPKNNNKISREPKSDSPEKSIAGINFEYRKKQVKTYKIKEKIICRAR